MLPFYRHLRVENTNGVTVVHFCAPTVERMVVDDVSSELSSLIGDGRIVLDFTGVRFFAKHLLTSLLAIHRLLCERGGRLVITGLAKSVYEIRFGITNLHKIFKICANREEAMNAFSA